MKFNSHISLAGMHSFLSPSSYHWLNYSDEKIIETFTTKKAAQRGTELHDFAAKSIELGIRLEETTQTLNQYVNDAIGFRMTPEQSLFYSPNCFGTADAISFHKNFLRIHDLKTGKTKASETQLYVYAAIFCLEYGFRPFDIEIECRIYQEGEIHIYEPDPKEIVYIMDKIKTFDRILTELNQTL